MTKKLNLISYYLVDTGQNSMWLDWITAINNISACLMILKNIGKGTTFPALKRFVEVRLFHYAFLGSLSPSL